jgi:hypothetical protein
MRPDEFFDIGVPAKEIRACGASLYGAGLNCIARTPIFDAQLLMSMNTNTVLR